MRISLVVAMAENQVIGVKNQLPWRLPAELKQFRSLTMGHPIIMGRKTFDSIGRPLPGRRNIVVTRNLDYAKEGTEIVHSLEEALERCRDDEEVFVIGGADVYSKIIARANRIYLTLVHVTIDGDAFFPAMELHDWQEIKRVPRAADAENIYAYDFIVYDRKATSPQ
ncbi:MAG: dihydrofolate reductase [Pseudomonadota bacterium]